MGRLPRTASSAYHQTVSSMEDELLAMGVGHAATFGCDFLEHVCLGNSTLLVK